MAGNFSDLGFLRKGGAASQVVFLYQLHQSLRNDKSSKKSNEERHKFFGDPKVLKILSK
jgi:hypothetical protein